VGAWGEAIEGIQERIKTVDVSLGAPDLHLRAAGWLWGMRRTAGGRVVTKDQ